MIPLIPEFYIKQVTWSTHEAALRLIRQQVFIAEQQVPETLEWDKYDAIAVHWLALDSQQQPIGCTRLLTNGSVGRMAVMLAWRSQGIGKALLGEAITLCEQRGYQTVKLSAQLHAIPFYERVGFAICSEAYLDANILHMDMQLNI